MISHFSKTAVSKGKSRKRGVFVLDFKLLLTANNTTKKFKV